MKITPSNLQNTISLSPKTNFFQSFALKVGDILNADVVDVIDSNSVLLKIASGDGTKSYEIIANTHVALSDRDSIKLKVTGLGNTITMQILEVDSRMHQGLFADEITEGIKSILSNLAISRLKGEEIRNLFRFLNSLPDNLSNEIPELRRLEDLLLEIEEMNAKTLRRAIEDSGIIFETRLKKAGLTGNTDIEKIADSDIKALILKIIEKLNNEEILNAVKGSGIDNSSIRSALVKVIGSIEFYQLTSYLNSIIYTFLPVLWQELKDGELIFKRESESKDSFSCRINLDMQNMGKLSTSVTLFNRSFYITIQAEDLKTVDLLLSSKGVLFNRFSDAGLDLAAFNIIHKEAIDFDSKIQDRFRVRV